METIVLGLLMMKSCTIYELHKYIKDNFSSISSNSMGSIQTALRKLLQKSMLDCREYMDNGIHKKAYSITSAGKRMFMQTVSTPMRFKEKNMELSKLFFMGFAGQDTWADLLDAYIAEMRKELMELEQIETDLSPRYSFGEGYLTQLRENGAQSEVNEDSINGIAMFQYATLDLGLAKLRFEIQWFEEFKKQLEQHVNG